MTGAGAPGARTWNADDGLHVDVRGLQAPQPLVLILQMVHEVGPHGVLIVHHDRDPLLLYPELVQIGWWAERIPGEPGEVRLRLAAAP
ncbi:MAG: DUF2249 domain-containing protein [Rubrivivax sp.]|jgi:hypothetical protein|nr:DUF2249 domain-containing protein [Betaproteobacteria bacterium]MBK7457368.1 DUF2249 domain-containing protein [Betaproteobacteria bacterium]MBP6320382.1 DUF2249 domain-containing protein [Rubrivivax sp.]MBP9910979.1 DUF2249 domain-containing protein [Rubrivivax sp.]